MRETKFRAWIPESKTMLYPNKREIIIVSFNGVATDSNLGKIMQYTGLHDKNGVEIFEGDILNAKTWAKDNMAERVFNKETQIQVIFDDGAFRGNDTTLLVDLIIWNRKINYEVIGNVWENPELLESEGK